MQIHFCSGNVSNKDALTKILETNGEKWKLCILSDSQNALLTLRLGAGDSSIAEEVKPAIHNGETKEN